MIISIFFFILTLLTINADHHLHDLSDESRESLPSRESLESRESLPSRESLESRESLPSRESLESHESRGTRNSSEDLTPRRPPSLDDSRESRESDESCESSEEDDDIWKGSHVLHLNDLNFDAALKTNRYLLVMFTDRNCDSHCIQQKKNFRDAARILRTQRHGKYIKLGEMNLEGNDVTARRYLIDSSPSYIIFRKGYPHYVKNKSLDSVDKIVAYVNYFEKPMEDRMYPWTFVTY